jgi:transcriptional regulator with XRE-family HTH domain
MFEMDFVRGNVKEIMKYQGLNNTSLALKIGVKKQNMSQILNGDQDLRLSTVQKIADALNVPLVRLFEPLGTSKNITSDSKKTKVVIQIELDEENGLKMSLGKDFMNFLKK